MASITKGFQKALGGAVKTIRKDIKRGYDDVKNATYGGGIYAKGVTFGDKVLVNKLGEAEYKAITPIIQKTSSAVSKGFATAKAAEKKVATTIGRKGFDVTSGKAFAGSAEANDANLITLRNQAKTQAAARDYASAARTATEIYDMIGRAPDRDPNNIGRYETAGWITSYYFAAGDIPNAQHWYDVRMSTDHSTNVPDIDQKGHLDNFGNPAGWITPIPIAQAKNKQLQTPIVQHWGYVTAQKPNQWVGSMESGISPIDDPGAPPGWKLAWPKEQGIR